MDSSARLGSVSKRKISCPLPGVEPLFIRRQPHSAVTMRSLRLTSPVTNTEIADVKVVQLLAGHTQQNTHLPSAGTGGGPAGYFPGAPTCRGR